jgi:hypothetical protein
VCNRIHATRKCGRFARAVNDAARRVARCLDGVDLGAHKRGDRDGEKDNETRPAIWKWERRSAKPKQTQSGESADKFLRAMKDVQLQRSMSEGSASSPDEGHIRSIELDATPREGDGGEINWNLVGEENATYFYPNKGISDGLLIGEVDVDDPDFREVDVDIPIAQGVDDDETSIDQTPFSDFDYDFEVDGRWSRGSFLTRSNAMRRTTR